MLTSLNKPLVLSPFIKKSVYVLMIIMRENCSAVKNCSPCSLRVRGCHLPVRGNTGGDLPVQELHHSWGLQPSLRQGRLDHHNDCHREEITGNVGGRGVCMCSSRCTAVQHVMCVLWKYQQVYGRNKVDSLELLEHVSYNFQVYDDVTLATQPPLYVAYRCHCVKLCPISFMMAHYFRSVSHFWL